MQAVVKEEPSDAMEAPPPPSPHAITSNLAAAAAVASPPQQLQQQQEEAQQQQQQHFEQDQKEPLPPGPRPAELLELDAEFLPQDMEDIERECSSSPCSMLDGEGGGGGRPEPDTWTPAEDKAFEVALAGWEEGDERRWEALAARLPGKSVEEVQRHYDALVQDIDAIEGNRVRLPDYAPAGGGARVLDGTAGGETGYDMLSPGARKGGGQANGVKPGQQHALMAPPPAPLPPAQQQQQQQQQQQMQHAKNGGDERKKGIPWTEEEHRLFLLGLAKFGKGDWRSISRNFVITRTPTQVASHAQKYFIRLNSINKDKRRSSIHDITSINNAAGGGGGPPGGGPGDPSQQGSPGGPITGQPALGAQVMAHHHPGPRAAMGMPGPPPPMYGSPVPQGMGHPMHPMMPMPPPGHMAFPGPRGHMPRPPPPMMASPGVMMARMGYVPAQVMHH